LGTLASRAASPIGNARMAPSLTSLASKSASASQQGSVLGVTQSVASLARAIGPLIQALLISTVALNLGFDRRMYNMSDLSLLRTFWTAGAIQFVAFLLAAYFARAYGREYSAGEITEVA